MLWVLCHSSLSGRRIFGIAWGKDYITFRTQVLPFKNVIFLSFFFLCLPDTSIAPYQRSLVLQNLFSQSLLISIFVLILLCRRLRTTSLLASGPCCILSYRVSLFINSLQVSCFFSDDTGFTVHMIKERQTSSLYISANLLKRAVRESIRLNDASGNTFITVGSHMNT